MFLNSWSLALTLTSLIILSLVVMAGRTAIRVLRFWNPASDDNQQILLENEIWLASTLMKYALGFQIITLVLFVLAADHFCQVIVGAMCATGALLANGFGMPTLVVKLVGVFLYGFWIVIHQLDINSESYPLARTKYLYLLLLIPFLLVDLTLQTLYIANLKPDIITSCCAVVFGEGKSSPNLIASLDREMILWLFYGTAAILMALGIKLVRRWSAPVAFANAAAWLWFLGLSLGAIIAVFSSYIYAMPFHRCPFCILKPEYNYIGFALYGSLLMASFFGINTAAVEPFKRKNDLADIVAGYQRFSVKISLTLLLIFAALASYHILLYRLTGGES